MSELHCLYCERPLAFLHRLGGDKEFCSKEHRSRYQNEHSQLALARLLQAQPQTAGNGQSREAAPATLAFRASILGLDHAEAPARPASALKVAPAPPTPASYASGGNHGPVDRPRFASVRYESGSQMVPRWRRPQLHRGTTPSAAGQGFLSPGSFLRRKAQPLQPPDYWDADGDLPAMPPLSTGVPSIRFLEERLARADRIGFCPP